MKKPINLATINIDGQKLKTAREERGISAADIAASLTLSRAQIVHIEEGGDKPFYTPAHKLLAVRKYANALNIPYEEIVTGEGAEQTIPVPKEEPPSIPTYSYVTSNNLSQISAAEDRMTATARNTEKRRRVLFGAVALCVVIALYAKVRGTAEEAKLPQSLEAQEELSVTEPVIEAPVADVAPAAAPVIAADQAAAEIAPVKSVASAEPAEPPNPVAVSAVETLQANASASEENCASEPASGELKSWSPAYQRKADTRLFVISSKGGTVCVTDNNGKSRLVSLRPMVGEPFVGKPPYTIRSSQLSSLDMYMQGLRVKVPADAKAIRLIPTSITAPEFESETTTSVTQ